MNCFKEVPVYMHIIQTVDSHIVFGLVAGAKVTSSDSGPDPVKGLVVNFEGYS